MLLFQKMYKLIKGVLEHRIIVSKFIGRFLYDEEVVHHIDKNKKNGFVSRMATSGFSKEIILKEISKCIVLCANCHKKEHYKKGFKSRS